MSDTYLIWSNEHEAWWKGGGWGYSGGLRGASHFTREQAIDICRKALPTSAHVGKIAEVPVRLTDLMEVLDGTIVPDVVLKSRNE